MIALHGALKEEYHKIFCFRFFAWIIFPHASEKTLGSFKFFWKIRGDIGKSWFTASVNYTGGKFVSGINDTSGKFATGIACVVDTGGKFATFVNDTGVKFADVVNERFMKNVKSKISWHCPFKFPL